VRRRRTIPHRNAEVLGAEVSTNEKAVSVLGGIEAIGALMFITRGVLGLDGGSMVIASAGASAVLLFAVPHGPLSQLWPVIGGHVISALVGVTAWQLIGRVEVAAALAVGGSIAAMHLLRCLHPPGGATALAAVIGSTEVHDLGFEFVLRPVALSAVIMVAIAVAFNAPFRRRRYPAARPRSAPGERPLSRDEVVAAIRSIDSFVDIGEHDLVRLVDLLSRHGGDRRTPPNPPPAEAQMRATRPSRPRRRG